MTRHQSTVISFAFHDATRSAYWHQPFVALLLYSTVQYKKYVLYK